MDKSIYKNDVQMTISGKRKTSVARATICAGTGQILINDRPKELLPELRRLLVEEPVEVTKEILGDFNFDISVNVNGGGLESQTEASRLAIARALVAFTKNDKLKRAFLSYDRNMLVADVRRKETRKPNDSKARARRQRSKR